MRQCTFGLVIIYVAKSFVVDETMFLKWSSQYQNNLQGVYAEKDLNGPDKIDPFCEKKRKLEIYFHTKKSCFGQKLEEERSNLSCNFEGLRMKK